MNLSYDGKVSRARAIHLKPFAPSQSIFHFPHPPLALPPALLYLPDESPPHRILPHLGPYISTDGQFYIAPHRPIEIKTPLIEPAVSAEYIWCNIDTTSNYFIVYLCWYSITAY